MIEQRGLEIIGTELRLGEVDEIEHAQGQKGDNCKGDQNHWPASAENPFLESIHILSRGITLRHEGGSRDKESGEH